MVVFYHLHANLEMVMAQWEPSWINRLFHLGTSGVPIFFVISGYVIAHSIGTKEVSLGYLGNFILRRSIRLDPPYWATIGISILFTYLSSQLFPSIGYREFPSFSQVVSHLLYLQNILGYGNIVAIFWTLCYEFQFYLFFIFYLFFYFKFISRQIDFSSRSTLVGLVLPGYLIGILSICIEVKIMAIPMKGLFINLWYLFFLGVLLRWSIVGKLPKPILYSFILFIILGKFVSYEDTNHRSVVGVVTAAIFLLASSKEIIAKVFENSLLLFLGRISYSVYLIHPVFGWSSISVCKKIFGSNMGVFEVVLSFLVGVAMSIITAHLFYLMLEKPALRLANRLRYVR